MIKKEFSELLKRLKTERLLSSEAEDLFRAVKGNRYALKLNFIQFSSVLGRQLNSNYNSGYKFECITEEELDVLVLFQDEHKELAGSLRGQTSREINVQVLGYDNLYQKPILGYVEGEIIQQELDIEDDSEAEAEAEAEAKTNIKTLLNSGPNHWVEDPEKVEGELKEGSAPKNLMTSFQYTALDAKGEHKTGIKQGTSAEEVIQVLRGEGLYPTQVVPEGQGMTAATLGKKGEKSSSSFLWFIGPPIIGLIMFIASINEGGNLVILGFFSFVLSIVLGVLFANVDDS